MIVVLLFVGAGVLVLVGIASVLGTIAGFLYAYKHPEMYVEESDGES